MADTSHMQDLSSAETDWPIGKMNSVNKVSNPDVRVTNSRQFCVGDKVCLCDNLPKVPREYETRHFKKGDFAGKVLAFMI